MIEELQLVEPGMHPFPATIRMLFIAGVGIIGVILVYFGIKWLQLKKQVVLSVIFLLIGIPSVSYPVLNWIGYNQIYDKNAKQIIGTFYSQNSDAVIQVSPDNTWVCKGKYIPCKSGTWEYHVGRLVLLEY